MSSPRLRDATVADLDALAALAAEAFAGLPLWNELIPDREQRHAVMLSQYRSLYSDALARGGRVRVVEDGQGLAAASLWSAPGRWRPATLRTLATLPAVTRALGLRATVRLLRLASAGQEIAVRAHPSEPHWYLSAVVTAERARGRGLGTLLMADGLEHVDAQRMPAYLECEPHLEDWYRRFGFNVRQVLEIPVGALDVSSPNTHLGMWRIPAHA